MSKTFAIFLPQFHEIEENNKWWGKGFTEWDNVKNAKSLFKGHQQPKRPLDGYYNLLNIDVMKKQTNMMKKYGIDGFVYYHYFFNGKLLLEKPAEMLLENPDIDQKFFFCWGNHTWTKGKGENQKILIKQEYGTEKMWRKHFEYLKPFFCDERYEKIDNKPVFMLYVCDFKEKKRMMNLFNEWCKEIGFSGIYIIETYARDLRKKNIKKFVSNISDCTENIYFREPNVATMQYYNRHLYFRLISKILRETKIGRYIKYVPKINGNKLYKIMLNGKYTIENRNITLSRGLFFGWDNTPRHGRKGYIITSPDYQMYKEYKKELKKSDMIIINAWNEWGEGMMLEPTDDDKYKYLEWVHELKTDERL